MIEQLALVGDPVTIAPSGQPLSRLQQLAWDYLRSSRDGRDAAEVGAWLHAHRARRPHGVDERCLYCGEAGGQVLRSAALKPLVIRRRSGTWQPRNPADRPYDGAQVDVLPDNLFGEAA